MIKEKDNDTLLQSYNQIKKNLKKDSSLQEEAMLKKRDDAVKALEEKIDKKMTGKIRLLSQESMINTVDKNNKYFVMQLKKM